MAMNTLLNPVPLKPPQRCRVLLTGSTGMLGPYVLRALRQAGHEVTPWGHQHAAADVQRVDLCDHAAITAGLQRIKPDVVLHAAALGNIKDVLANPALARAVNVHATAHLASEAACLGARLISISTDLVFDGEAAPYAEHAIPRPLSLYGQTKLEGELAVLSHPQHLVVRVSLLFGPVLGGRPKFFDQMVADLRTGRPVTLFEDEWRTPLDLCTAADILTQLVSTPAQGLLHAGGSERLSRLEMGLKLAAFLKLDPRLIRPASRLAVPGPEPRPRDTSLDSGLLEKVLPKLGRPSFEEALQRLSRIIGF